MYRLCPRTSKIIYILVLSAFNENIISIQLLNFTSISKCIEGLLAT